MRIFPAVTELNAMDLFWATLEPYRETQHYNMLRNKIDELVTRRANGQQTSARDKRFNKKSGGPLEGIWHCAISRSPDVVVFYTLENGAMNLAMVGTHHDYPSDGKNLKAAGRTSTRIQNAIKKGFSLAAWKHLDWRDIDGLLNSTELYEASTEALDTLYQELIEELDSGNRLKQIYQLECDEDLEKIPENEFVEHFEKVDLLRKKCHEIMQSQPITSTNYLKIVKDSWEKRNSSHPSNEEEQTYVAGVGK